jgi:polysaccharide biosynthesis protein PslG
MRLHETLLLLTLLSVSVTVTTESQITSTPIPPSFFGLHVVEVERHWPSIPFGSLGKCQGAVWYIIQGESRDNFKWKPVDRCVDAAEQHHMDVFFATEGVPQWAAKDPSSCYGPPAHPERRRCRSTVRNIKDWDNFITALAERYKGKLIYELWNEPHNGREPEVGSVKDMVELTTHEYNIIRSIDPHAIILAPSISTIDYMNEYYAEGGPRGVDGVTFHGNAAEPEELLNKINQIREVLAKYGMTDKPLWATEGGHWGSRDLSPDERAAFVGRVELLYWSRGVVRHYWYGWDNPHWGTLWDEYGGLQPAGKAYEQIYKWMVGAVMDKPCTSEGTTWTCGFTRQGGYEALAIWNTSGSSGFTPNSQYKQYRDLDGNTSPIKGPVNIGIKPILLEKPAEK